MDWLTFISSVIKSLAWPSTVAYAFYFALHNGKQIAAFIKSFKYKDIEVVLRDQLDEAKELSDEIRILSKPILGMVQPEPNDSQIGKLAVIDPSVAVLKIWQGLETKIIRCIQFNGLMRFTDTSNFMRRLAQKNKITNSELELFKRLRAIRNEVVHVPVDNKAAAITLAEVIEYKDLVELLIQRIDSVTTEAGQERYFDLDDKVDREVTVGGHE